MVVRKELFQEYNLSGKPQGWSEPTCKKVMQFITAFLLKRIVEEVSISGDSHLLDLLPMKKIEVFGASDAADQLDKMHDNKGKLWHKPGKLLVSGKQLKTFFASKWGKDGPELKTLNVFALFLNPKGRGWIDYERTIPDENLIVVEETEDSSSRALKAWVRIGLGTPYEVAISPPASRKEELNLEWYFDEYLKESYSVPQLENALESLKNYGVNLFQTIFADPYRVSEFEELRARLFDQNITLEIISRTNHFDSLQWELMQKSPQENPFICRGMQILRRFNFETERPLKIQPAPNLRILLVTSRPYGEKDVQYHTVQKPVVDALRDASKVQGAGYYPVVVDILRPGTYDSLMEHLGEDGKQGYYHIIHFDLHGTVTDYITLQRKKEQKIYNFRAFKSFDIRDGGAAEIEKFDGFKAFLLFEGKKQGIADIIVAEDIATLVHQSGIPICILNACQSAKYQTMEEETNLAKILSQKGLDMVVAMRFSISEDGAHYFCTELYQALKKDQSLEFSINQARIKLWRSPKRTSPRGEELVLQDWSLPVIYRNRSPQIKLSPSSTDGRDLLRSPQTLNEFDEYMVLPKYVNRDLLILRLERWTIEHLRTGIRGMQGTGKSLLLKYLSWWWEETDFAEFVFYYSFNDDIFTLSDILEKINSRLKLKGFDDWDLDRQQNEILKRLNSSNMIIILDNLDGRNDGTFGFQKLGDVEAEMLIKWLKRVKHKSRLILAMRSVDKFIGSLLHEEHFFEIKGFLPHEVYEFARGILKVDDETWDSLLNDSDFEDLLTCLHGIPSALKKFLPPLKKEPPVKVYQMFRNGELG